MYFDVAMPIMLFAVVLVAMFLNDKVEKKLKKVIEEREFKVRDTILLVAVMSIAISLVVFIPQMAIMIIFLFAYSMLLFTFTFVFSSFQKTKAILFNATFLIFSLTAIFGLQYGLVENNLIFYGTLSFLGLFCFSLGTIFYEAHRKSVEERWYLAVLPPTLFILLYTFFGRTVLWFPYLLNLYGIIFAVLIILYLGSLFTWRTTLIFSGLITIMDVILVLYTGTMVSVAMHVSELRLPVLVSIPIIPTILKDGKILYMSLGLGDFFFAGLLSIQTMKMWGKGYAMASLVAMVVSFFIFEVLMFYWKLIALPGTLMIISGWVPLLLYKTLSAKIKRKVA